MTDRMFYLDDTADIAAMAMAIADGAAVAHGFANFYAITARMDTATVRGINRMKGRPLDQVGSVVTTASHFDGLFDWSELPSGLTRRRVRDLMENLFALGPIGFRGPAARSIPDHLTSRDGGIRTVQLIAPGSACLSNRFLSEALARAGHDFLYITSGNRSRHQTGAADEPAHFLGDALAAEFARETRFHMLRHRDEFAARAAYPVHAPMSTSVLAFHKLAGEKGAPPSLVLEREGSLPIEVLADAVAGLGMTVTRGPNASGRLSGRVYLDARAA